MASWTGGTGAGSKPSLSRTSNEAKKEQAAKQKKPSGGGGSTPANANFSNQNGQQQQVDASGKVMSNAVSTNEPNFSRADGQEVFIPPPPTASTNGRPSGGTIREATTTEKFYGSPVGELVSGVKASFGPDGTGNDPATMSRSFQAGQLAGVLGQLYAMRGFSAEIGALASSQVSTLSKVGTLGRAGKAATTAETIATNAATIETTTSWLTKVARSATSPQAVAGTLVAAIGSYPFAGFIKEEALQTLSFGTKSALENNDLENAQAALDLQREILHPDIFSQIIAKVPFANVIANLEEFYDAAQLKVNIDQHIVDNLKIKVESGESDDEYWARVYREREHARTAQRAADEKYYAEVAKRQAEAKAASRAEDEAYWQKIADERAVKERERQEEEDAYWSAYYRRSDELRKPQGLSYSKLNFGLLK